MQLAIRLGLSSISFGFQNGQEYHGGTTKVYSIDLIKVF